MCRIAAFLLVAVAFVGGTAAESTAVTVPIPPDKLQADPWVTPPRSVAELRACIGTLRERYAPYLRSLPEKVAARPRQELRGPWRSRFEMSESTDGRRPPAPDWFGPSVDESGWEPARVPEWRWLPIKKDGRWYPASCILWYRSAFSAAAAPAGQRVYLCFAGVDWEAEVWLNGTFLGRHKVYYEPFRFEITGLLKPKNTLAVRVLEGPAFGEPMSQWSLMPFVPGDAGSDQRYVRGDRLGSFPGDKFGTTSSLGSGFGIHREVYLETAGPSAITEIFARCHPGKAADLSVEADAAAEREATLELQILPENFEGRSYQKTQNVRLRRGRGVYSVALPMPDARAWWPAEPCLYRCRATLRDGQEKLDARDALFGCRSFGVTSESDPRPGQFVLNGRPIFLRGTNLSGALNAYWYWNQSDKLLEAILLLKAANFNAIRLCQHVSFPEVRELFDRLGMMSEQDQGAGFEIGHDVSATLAETGKALARACYNHPGVVLLSFANETHIDTTAVVANALSVDPERIIVPVSGGTFALTDQQHRNHLVVDRHPYEGWYGGVHQLWESARTRPPARLYTMGEYGAEALDGYETMLRHYPRHWGAPPRIDEDRLWGARQTGTGRDLRQQFGFRGRKPANLGQYIEASQNYQADVLAEATKGFRLSKQAVGGYFQFHFLDGTAAQWPKSIVSHDFLPKKGFFEMAQVNQPLVPLYRLADEGRAMEIWVANDLALCLSGCRVRWVIQGGGKRIEAEAAADVPASSAVLVKTVALAGLPPEAELLKVALTLSDGQGRKLSQYEREVYRSFKFIPSAKEQAEFNAIKKAVVGSANLAIGKPVVVTSAREDAPGTKAVDGGTRTGWRAADNRLPQSLAVDLGRPAVIGGLRLIWEGDANRELEIQVSDDGRDWKPVGGKIRGAILQVPRAPLMFLDQYLLFDGKGRYLRVNIKSVSDGSPAGFNEIEVYGK